MGVIARIRQQAETKQSRSYVNKTLYKVYSGLYGIAAPRLGGARNDSFFETVI